MTEIISVRFKSGGKDYYFNPNGLQVQEGQEVIIETAKGMECATCVKGNSMIDEEDLISPLRPVVRIATPGDLLQVERNKEREKNAYKICQKKIAEHCLEMKLVDVKYSFDGSKILFYFTADGRVDFRSLVKDLASVFRTRIELRQIGVRDEAKMLGGLGVCGRAYCCSTFLNDFHPVSIKMAKTQTLSLNPTKISGACGRLMCCLKYEQDAYQDLIKRAPRQDSLVETPDGLGTVCQVNLLRETSKVILDSDPDSPQVYPNSELTVVRSGKGRRPAGYEKPEENESRPAPQQRRERSAPVWERISSSHETAGTAERRPARSSYQRQPQENAPAPAPEQEEPRRSRPHYRRHRSHSRGGQSGGEA